MCFTRAIIARIMVLLLIACRSSDDQTMPVQPAQSPLLTQTTPPSPRTLPSTVSLSQAQAAGSNTLIPTGTPSRIVYEGRTLPRPTPHPVLTMQPPPAWFILQAEAIPATYGNFCYTYNPSTIKTCADWGQELPPSIATVPISAEEPLVIVLGLGAAPSTNLAAQVGLWHEATVPTTTQTLSTTEQHEADAMIVELERPSTREDQLLMVQVTFGDYGAAT
jgi:hypothetical protein